MMKAEDKNMMVYNKKGEDDYFEEIFKETSMICERLFDHEKAYEFLTENIELSELPTSYLKEYCYYAGSAKLIGYNDLSSAMYYFQLGYCSQNEDDTFFQIMLTNMIGIVYFLEFKIDEAKEMLDNSLNEMGRLNSFEFKHFEKMLLVIYNVAKFYSEIKEYNRAELLCSEGIEIGKSENIMSHLEKLYYEKAFNLAKQNKLKGAKDNYLSAYVLAKIKNNLPIIKTIKKDMEGFKIGLDFEIE